MAGHVIPVEDNIIYTQRIGSTDPKDSRETILLGAERVDVGINSGEKEIAHDDISGLNYERNRIDSKTIYDLSKQKRKCFFVLDLETGRGKGCWFPGSIHVCDTKDIVDLKSDMSDDSQTLIQIPANTTVKILDLMYDANRNIWYNLVYNEIEGFTRNTNVENAKYIDPSLL